MLPNLQHASNIYEDQLYFDYNEVSPKALLKLSTTVSYNRNAYLEVTWQEFQILCTTTKRNQGLDSSPISTIGLLYDLKHVS